MYYEITLSGVKICLRRNSEPSDLVPGEPRVCGHRRSHAHATAELPLRGDPTGSTWTRSFAAMDVDAVRHPQNLIDNRHQRVGIDRFEQAPRWRRHRFRFLFQAGPPTLGNEHARHRIAQAVSPHGVQRFQGFRGIVSDVADQQILPRSHLQGRQRGIRIAGTRALVVL